MTQAQAVIETINKLGGIATLSQINQKVFEIEDCVWGTKTPFASIRRIVRTTRDIFVVRKGVYALEDFREELKKKGVVEQTVENTDSIEVKEFNHSYYQGMLLEMGKVKHFDTFVPDQDKNRKFGNVKLADIRTLNKMPDFSYPKFVNKSSSIDVIWFNNRKMPNSFFEVEHTTDIQNSLLKYLELQDFHVRMVIVADEKRHEEFGKKLGYIAFNDINKRVKFLSYKSLERQYEQLMFAKDCDLVL